MLFSRLVVSFTLGVQFATFIGPVFGSFEKRIGALKYRHHKVTNLK